MHIYIFFALLDEERTRQKGDKRRNRSGLMSKREAQEKEAEEWHKRRGKKDSPVPEFGR